MRRGIFQLLGIALGAVVLGLPLNVEANIAAVQQRMVEIFDEHSNAVVRVKAAYRETRADGRPHVTLRVGTGFFINREGYVMVNASRAAGAERVWVEHEDRAFAALMVGYDRLTNIALLQVLEPPDEFGYIPLEVGVARPRIGSMVFALAHALDFDVSPSFGLITGVENRVGAQIFPTHYIRSTISVDAGEGGAPLVDINGRLIGVTIASIPEISSSYALPVEAVIRVRDDLLANGEMIHSWMGFEIAERVRENETRTVVLSRVLEGTPAYEGGLRENDILLSISGQPIRTVADVPGTVFFTRANQLTTVAVDRNGERLEFSVRTVARPEDDPLLIQPDEEKPELPTGVTPRDLELIEQQ